MSSLTEDDRKVLKAVIDDVVETIQYILEDLKNGDLAAVDDRQYAVKCEILHFIKSQPSLVKKIIRPFIDEINSVCELLNTVMKLEVEESLDEEVKKYREAWTEDYTPLCHMRCKLCKLCDECTEIAEGQENCDDCERCWECKWYGKGAWCDACRTCKKCSQKYASKRRCRRCKEGMCKWCTKEEAEREKRVPILRAAIKKNHPELYALIVEKEQKEDEQKEE